MNELIADIILIAWRCWHVDHKDWHLRIQIDFVQTAILIYLYLCFLIYCIASQSSYLNYKWDRSIQLNLIYIKAEIKIRFAVCDIFERLWSLFDFLRLKKCLAYNRAINAVCRKIIVEKFNFFSLNISLQLEKFKVLRWLDFSILTVNQRSEKNKKLVW